MDIHHRRANKKNREYFSKAIYFNALRNFDFLNSISTEKSLVKHAYSSFKRPPDTELGNHNVFAIDFPYGEKRNIFLFLKEEEKDEEEQKKEYCVLLISGETKINEFEPFDEFLIGQIKADEKAFKCGLIWYPVYEMLRTVLKLINDRREAYSITVTGKRELFYCNDNARDRMIRVNLEEGTFTVNESESYIDYMPTLNRENLRELIEHKCYNFADKLNLDLAFAVNKPKTEETETDCEILVYLGLKQKFILCGRGNETKKLYIFNKVNDDVNVQKSPFPIRK